MLTYDSLIEQAKTRGMPPTKMRGILREYLQVLILKDLYKSDAGKKLYFTGGTYLRLVHNLKRFSEDLDFNTAAMTQKEFETLLQKIGAELSKVGFKTEVDFDHWENLYVARIIFGDIEKKYNVSSPFSKKEGIIIKVETNKPRWKITTETQVVSGFGEFYPCVCTDISHLFADKIDALIKKNRARHLYDILFMLSNRYPMNQETLKALGIKEDPLQLILTRVKSLSKEELKKFADNLRPFLFNESEADLLLNAHQIIPSLIERYQQR